MNKSIFGAVLAGGIVLLIFGINANHSFNSGVSRFFTGQPTNQAMWMLIGGAVLSAVGLIGLFMGSRRS